jgi:hypothetical protein
LCGKVASVKALLEVFLFGSSLDWEKAKAVAAAEKNDIVFDEEVIGEVHGW